MQKTINTRERLIDAPVGAPGVLHALARRPRLYIVEAFATAAEVRHVLDIAADEDSLIERQIAERDPLGLRADLPVVDHPVLRALRERTLRLVRLGNDFEDTLRLRRYYLGRGQSLHHDSYEADGSTLILTAMLYLNTTAKGGETRFPRAHGGPISVRPRRGRMLLWFSHLRNGREDPTAMHEGLPVRSGEKSILINFIYQPLERTQRRIPGGRRVSFEI